MRIGELIRKMGGMVMLAAAVIAAQKGTTLNAGDTLYPGWADSLGTNAIVAGDGKLLCCGSWFLNETIKFNSIDFGTTPYKFLVIDYSAGEPGCNLVLSHDQPNITAGGGTSILDAPHVFNALPLAPTGGWKGHLTARIRIKPVTGVQPLYLFSGRCQVSGGTLNMGWYTFTNDSVTPVHYDWAAPRYITIQTGEYMTGVARGSAIRATAESIRLSRAGLRLGLAQRGEHRITVTTSCGKILGSAVVTGPGEATFPVGAMIPGVYLVRIASRGRATNQPVIVR